MNQIKKLIKKNHLKEFLTDLRATALHTNSSGIVGATKISKLEINTIEAGNQMPAIQFSLVKLEGMDCPHQDALVITANIANYDVAIVFIDCGSSVDILFMKAFLQMDLGPIKNRTYPDSPGGFFSKVCLASGANYVFPNLAKKF
ncbi:hypothetical protein CDL12_01765 [Handroanthus impetiginosus]|uniref:Uncharacterized protein n=1 Tax=Handroanthus impetiginosus TaxID=429701 RepID=A0A2G9I6X8_9LAMI|nr:hypothetical protein CDL12_01765 [Handroanthus impetiginosus]